MSAAVVRTLPAPLDSDEDESMPSDSFDEPLDVLDDDDDDRGASLVLDDVSAVDELRHDEDDDRTNDDLALGADEHALIGDEELEGDAEGAVGDDDDDLADRYDDAQDDGGAEGLQGDDDRADIDHALPELTAEVESELSFEETLSTALPPWADNRAVRLRHARVAGVRALAIDEARGLVLAASASGLWGGEGEGIAHTNLPADIEAVAFDAEGALWLLAQGAAWRQRDGAFERGEAAAALLASRPVPHVVAPGDPRLVVGLDDARRLLWLVDREQGAELWQAGADGAPQRRPFASQHAPEALLHAVVGTATTTTFLVEGDGLWVAGKRVPDTVGATAVVATQGRTVAGLRTRDANVLIELTAEGPRTLATLAGAPRALVADGRWVAVLEDDQLEVFRLAPLLRDD